MSSDLVKHAAEIVGAYVSNNEIRANEVPGLINQIYGTLSSLSGGKLEEMAYPVPHPIADESAKQEKNSAEGKSIAATSRKPAPKIKPKPAVAIDKAVREDAVTCLICGKACQALKGHLTRSHKVNVDDYRQMFDLPKDFPLVSPSYSARRRQLAIDAGLGEKLRESRKEKRSKKNKP
ncbi:MAG: MucR family transcriptional regulator [Magnetococcales bacterium]|nr:MucR family transcriptional regulator [Magnetococcales bacterium]